MGLKEKKCILPLSIVSPIYCCCDHFSLRHIRLGDTVKPRLKGALYLLVRMRHLKVKLHSPNLKTRKLGVGRGWRGIYQVPWVVLSFSTAVTDTQWALSTKDAVVRLTAKETTIWWNYFEKSVWRNHLWHLAALPWWVWIILQGVAQTWWLQMGRCFSSEGDLTSVL